VGKGKPRRVTPLFGFPWRRTDTGSRVTLHEPAVLSNDERDDHLDLLHSTHQWWHVSEAP
jgi:hypothetical protein